MKPVKVVILNWNGRSHLERFLPVLVARTPGADIVVADNGSTDDSADFIRARFPQVELLLLDRNYGFAEGYNRPGPDRSRLLRPAQFGRRGDRRWLAPLVELLERDSAAAAAVAPKIRSYANPGKFEYAGAAGGFIDFWAIRSAAGESSTRSSPTGAIRRPARSVLGVGACMLVRSEVFRRLGGFDGDFFAHMEEIDFCWRAQLAGYRIRVEIRAARCSMSAAERCRTTVRRKFTWNFRNNLCMLFKNLSPGTFWPVLFSRMVLDGMAALVFLVQGHPRLKKVFRAHIDFHRQRKSLHEKKTCDQRHRVARPHGILRNSIILLHAFGCRTFRQSHAVDHAYSQVNFLPEIRLLPMRQPLRGFRSKSSKLRITRATPSSRASTAGSSPRNPLPRCIRRRPAGRLRSRNGIFDDHATRRSKPDRASRFQVNVRIRLTGQCSVVIDDLFRIEPTLQTETTDEERSR